MNQLFTKQEKKKAKQSYNKGLKFNAEAHKHEKQTLQRYAIDTKVKSKVDFTIGHCSILILTN